jgi:hypothetical protein
MKRTITLCAVVLLMALATRIDAQEAGPRNVRLIFQLIEADGFPDVDPAIEDIVEELNGLFRFDGYRLLTTSILTGALGDDADRLGQVLSLADHGRLQLNAWIYPWEAGETVRVSVSLEDRARGANSEILNVSVRVRNHQTVVLGSAQSRSAAGVLILAMRVELGPTFEGPA